MCYFLHPSFILFPMRYFYPIIVIILYTFISIHAANTAEPKYQDTKKERFKQYLTGIKYLETANTLSEEEKVVYYKKLVEITGFTAEDAHEYIKKYEDTPERWIKLIESVLEMINNPPDIKEKE